VQTIDTYKNQWGTFTWKDTYTKTETTETTKLFSITIDYSTSYSTSRFGPFFGDPQTFEKGETYKVIINGYWQDGIEITAKPMIEDYNYNNFAASSILSGCASPFNIRNPALLVGPAGKIITGDSTYAFGARTVVVPYGAITTENWTLFGAAASVVGGVGGHVPLINGEGATGNKTIVINAGIWTTLNKNGFGTIEIEQPVTQEGSFFSNTKAYLPSPIVISAETDEFFFQFTRFFTSSRHTSTNIDSQLNLIVGSSYLN
jgi:hypothetical protein